MNTPIPNPAPVLRAVLFASALSLFTSSGALAATISFIGVEPGTAGSGFAAQNWSNPGVAKTYDLSGDVYGTAGYYQIRPIAYPPGSTIYAGAAAGNNLGITADPNPTLYSAPVMLSSISGSAGDYVNFNSYAVFRGPDGSALYTQGGLSVPVNQGPYNTPSGSNNGYFGNAFSFTMGMSATYRVGVAVDMVASGTYAPNYVSLYNGGTGTVYSQSLTRDGTPDMTVFEIDAAAGDSFTTALWQLSGTQSAAAFGLITFDVSQYKFDVGSGLSQTNSVSLNGAPAAVLKTGAGTLVMASSNSAAGGTLISGGTLALHGGSVKGGITNNANLSITADLTNVVSGTGSLTKTGAGIAAVWNPMTYTGATVVDQGQLMLAGSGALSTNTAVQIASGASVNLTGYYAEANTNRTIAGLTGAGVLYGGGGTVTVNKTSGSDTFSGDIQGGQGLIKSGNGTLVLSGSNSFTGSTSVNAGTLRIVNGNALGSTNGGTTVNQGGVLRLTATNDSGVAVVGEVVTLVGGTNTNASFISDRVSAPFLPTNTFQGKIALLDDARIDSLGSSTLVLTNVGNVIESTNNADLTISGAGTVRLNGAISNGTGIVTKNGSGQIFVAGNGNLGGAAGGVALNSGNIDLGGLSLTNASFTITGGVITNGTLTATTYNLNGGSVRANLGAGTINAASGTTSVTNGGALGATTVNVTGGTLNLGEAGRLATNATVTLAGGQLSLGGNETIASLAGSGGTLALGASTLTVGSGNSASQITGGGILTKIGAATLTLSGNNSYSGGTLLNGGWLVAAHTNAFGTGSVTVGSGTTLNLTNFNIANLVINNGGTILSTGTLDDVIATNGTTDIGGNNSTIEEVGGTAVVNVTGSSVVVSNATGGTLNADGSSVQVASVSGGTVNLGGSSAEVTAASGGTVNANASGATLGTVSGTAAVNIAGTNARVATLSGGSVAANAAGLVVTNFNGGNIAVSNGVTVGLRGGSSSGVISGQGGIAKQSADTLTISGVNTLSGATTVEEGKLVVNGSLNNSAVTVQSGATLGGSGSIGTLTLNGILAPGNSAGQTDAGATAWNQGGSYNWEIFNLAGPAGTGWDLLNITNGSLNLSGITSPGGFTINLITLTTNNSTPGPLDGFNAAANYTNWLIASAPTINDFSVNLFTLNTNSFVGATGTFALEQRAYGGGQGLFLNYTGAGAAVPEPGTWAAAALLALAAGYARRRKAKSSSPSAS